MQNLDAEAFAGTKKDSDDYYIHYKLWNAYKFMKKTVWMHIQENPPKLEIGSAKVQNDLRGSFVKLLSNLTLVESRLGCFPAAVYHGKEALRKLRRSDVEDFPRDMTARLHYHLALAHLGLSKVEAPDPTRRRTVYTHLDEALVNLVRALEFAPHDMEIRWELDALLR